MTNIPIEKGFKSLVPDVTTVDAMEEKVGYALDSQHFFERRTSLWERGLWKGKLKNFTLDLKKVDRLYHISNMEDDNDREYELLVRMVHNDNQHIFVELTAGCNYSAGFNHPEGGGVIYVGFNPNGFFKNVKMLLYNEDRIYQSLSEDGYRVDRDSVASRRDIHYKYLVKIMNKKLKNELMENNKKFLDLKLENENIKIKLFIKDNENKRLKNEIMKKEELIMKKEELIMKKEELIMKKEELIEMLKALVTKFV